MFNKKSQKISKKLKKAQISKKLNKSPKKSNNLKKNQNISNLMIAWKNKAAKPPKNVFFIFFDYILHVIVEFIAAVICFSGIRRTQQPPLLNPLPLKTTT